MRKKSFKLKNVQLLSKAKGSLLKETNSFSRTYIGRTELIHHQVRQQFLQNMKV